MVSRRYITITIVTALLSTIGLGIFGIYSYRRPLPQTEGALQIPGLRADVTIYRDGWGVPHIYASNAHDLFLAQGYVHAQDRWWQMEMNRHLGMGNLSIIIGNNEAAQNTDRFIHTLGWYRSAKVSWRDADPEIRSVLNAYTQGVNTYIQDRDQGDLAVQYTLLGLTGRGFEITDWQPVHSLTWLIAFNWSMNSNLSDEFNNVQVLNQLPPELAALYLPEIPQDIDYTSLNATLAGGALPNELALIESNLPIRANSWVVNGKLTDSGAPLLAADLQMPVGIPSEWYEVGLHCVEITITCPYDVVGFSLAGVPGVLVGHNTQIAWSMNPTSTDTQDVFILPINPDTPTRYFYQGEWRDMQVLNDFIPVNDAEPIRWQIYLTELGAIINDYFGSQEALILHWTKTQPTELLAAILQLDAATNWQAFRSALALWNGSVQTFLYTDISGNIGMQTAGQIPVRQADHSGLLPVSIDDLWAGFIPYEQLPSQYNPAQGWIINESVSADQEQTWDEIHRTERIEALLMESQHNPDTFTSIQADNYNPLAAALVPYVLDLDFSAEIDEKLLTYQQWLAEWNFHNDIESPYPILFSMFWARLVESVFDDQLNAESGGMQHQRYMMLQLLTQPEHPWWDDIRTPNFIETRDLILRQAFDAAIDDAQGQFGVLKNRWRWGDLHTATFKSVPLGDSGVAAIDELLNRGPVGMGGGFSSIDTTSWSTRRADRYEVVTAPAFRMIVDLSNFENSRSILSTGQSGHPASPHYDDMIDLWRSVAYRDMLWERNSIRDASESTLRLRPGVNQER